MSQDISVGKVTKQQSGGAGNWDWISYRGRDMNRPVTSIQYEG
jgi:hypothetical protein